MESEGEEPADSPFRTISDQGKDLVFSQDTITVVMEAAAKMTSHVCNIDFHEEHHVDDSNKLDASLQQANKAIINDLSRAKISLNSSLLPPLFLQAVIAASATSKAVYGSLMRSLGLPVPAHVEIVTMPEARCDQTPVASNEVFSEATSIANPPVGIPVDDPAEHISLRDDHGIKIAQQKN